MSPHSEAEKALAAQAAAALVADGMLVGLGTGSTVAHLLPALAQLGLDVTCVATSPRTAVAAAELGLRVVDFQGVTRLDIAIDGTDQVDPAGWLVKGGGAAHTREKIVAAAADRFVVIADHSKTVAELHAPIPLELLEFGLGATIARLERELGPVTRRDVPRSPDGGVIADFHGSVADPAALAAALSAAAGVVEHGLFAPSLVTDLIVARGTEVTHRVLS